MQVTNMYTSVACNRTPDALDWGDDGLIYYAANFAVAILDPNHNGSVKVLRTLVAHKGRVNTVKTIRNWAAGDVNLLSGSDDGTCILWDTHVDSTPAKYTLKGHTKGVTTVDAIASANGLTVATGSADCSVKLWHKATTEYVCLQTLDLRTGLCFALKLFHLPKSEVTVLAFATDTDVVNLYAASSHASNDAPFVPIEQLKGHSDWVRGLDCVRDPDGEDLLLVSSSQDHFTRLWRISARDTLRARVAYDEIPDDEDIALEERTFSLTTADGSALHYALSLESVLQGHEGWVYGVNFCVKRTTDGKQQQQLHLLSSSIDKSLIVWTPSDCGLWLENVRVGEIGGSSLGFYGGKFSPDGRSIIGHGFQGSLHLWHQDAERNAVWCPGVIIGGHHEAVRDLAWDPKGGDFLVSTSVDQTTRVHAAWKRNDHLDTATWHEIGRPQVHGYDMQCLTLLSRYVLASAAEEKIIRVFQAPSNFVQNFRALCQVTDDPEGEEIIKNNPMGASVPSLGLSNKAVFDVEQPEPETRHIKEMYPEHYFVPTAMTKPPTEETLMQNTLWPENQKLYGHGNELFTVAASPDGQLLASACRATSAEHAQILIWDCKTWRILQKLSAHQLTVTQLKFAPNNRQLLAVSRDRTLSVYENAGTSPCCDYQLIMHTGKSDGVHTRIIWCCDWSHDSELFATGSRDGKVVSWQRETTGSYKHSSVLELKNESVTAVAFAHATLADGRFLVAVGLEKGSIRLYAALDWTLLATIDETCAHHLTVKRLAFRPQKDQFQLASCGDDNLVRVYHIAVNKKLSD